MLLYSEKLKFGLQAPDFNLPGVDGLPYTLSSFEKAEVLVVMFLCNHCPYVQAVEDRIIEMRRDYQQRGVQLVGICANDPTDYPDDSPESLEKSWRQKDYGFPYLIDDTQETARAYGAVCTPEFFVFDRDRKLAYHGQLDDSWKDPARVKRRDLREALDRLLAGEKPQKEQTPSMGCSIKWKRGAG